MRANTCVLLLRESLYARCRTHVVGCTTGRNTPNSVTEQLSRNGRVQRRRTTRGHAARSTGAAPFCFSLLSSFSLLFARAPFLRSSLFLSLLPWLVSLLSLPLSFASLPLPRARTNLLTAGRCREPRTVRCFCLQGEIPSPSTTFMTRRYRLPPTERVATTIAVAASRDLSLSLPVLPLLVLSSFLFLSRPSTPSSSTILHPRRCVFVVSLFFLAF